MTLKIIGSSIKGEFVKCDVCKKDFVWLNAYLLSDEDAYYVRCRKCRIEVMGIK